MPSAAVPYTVSTVIEQSGASLWYLPAYSPNRSPIEEAFSTLKGLLRRVQARSHDALAAAIGKALGQITAADAHGSFAYLGYGTQVQ